VRDPEVDQRCTVGAEQDVGRFDVAVHHPGGVDGGQRGEEIGRHRAHIVLGQRAVRDHHLFQ
jgi:hypothetical protein